MPCRKSAPTIRANRSAKSAMTRKIATETITKYLSASAFVRTKSFLSKPMRKKGSAASRYICVKSISTTPIFTTAP